MQLIFAKNLGFCTGVKRAIKIAGYSLESDPKPIQFLGGIIHNEKIINEIKDNGGKIVNDTRGIRRGTLVIRAHGTAPLPHLKNILIRDATCTLVKHSQEVAKKLLKDGYEIVIIGKKNHPEITGILGNINGKAMVIESTQEAKKIKKIAKLGVLAQTTQSQENVDKILNILRKKTKELKWEDTLCPQVSFRQQELSEIIKKTDGILVIGSHTSANTKRLVEIAQKNNKPVWCTNSENKLKKIIFKNISSLGVVSGTSAPDWEVKKIIDYLNNYAKKEKN
jgi:(E)-4-hydroxy-3-methyl-but-2-enyl pyrophosphate reductase